MESTAGESEISITNESDTISTGTEEGESAYKTFMSGNAEIPKEENGMEYVVITLNVTYNGGTPDNLYIMEDYASLDSAKIFFALSN